MSERLSTIDEVLAALQIERDELRQLVGKLLIDKEGYLAQLGKITPTRSPRFIGWPDPNDVDRYLEKLCADFAQRGRKARATARKAYRASDRPKWEKFHAVARVWEMAADRLELLQVPF